MVVERVNGGLYAGREPVAAALSAAKQRRTRPDAVAVAVVGRALGDRVEVQGKPVWCVVLVVLMVLLRLRRGLEHMLLLGLGELRSGELVEFPGDPVHVCKPASVKKKKKPDPNKTKRNETKRNNDNPPLTFVLGPGALPPFSRSRSLHELELPLDTLVPAVDTLRTLPAYRLHPLERQLLLPLL